MSSVLGLWPGYAIAHHIFWIQHSDRGDQHDPSACLCVSSSLHLLLSVNTLNQPHEVYEKLLGPKPAIPAYTIPLLILQGFNLDHERAQDIVVSFNYVQSALAGSEVSCEEFSWPHFYDSGY